MRHHHAKMGARVCRPLLPREEGSRCDPHGKGKAEADERAPAAEGERQREAEREAHAERPAQQHRELGQAGALPARERADSHQEQRRRHQRHEHRLEVRRAHRDLAGAERVERERVERAEHHRGSGDGEQHIVPEQRRLARSELEAAAQADARSAPCEQHERPADEQHEQREDEHAARRIHRESVHRGQHAGANEESSKQAKREGDDGEQHGPAAEGSPLLGHGERMDQRGPHQPGHERGVFHRVPEPPAAPAELVVGPAAAERDADGEKRPGHRGPGTRPARPGGVELAGKQRRDGEGEGDREADVAHVQHRRVQHHAGVLQQRIQVAAVGRGRQQPVEGIRREEQESEESRADQSHHAEHARHYFLGKMRAEEAHRRHPDAEHQRPQQQRAFVPAPYAGDAVMQG